MSDYRRFGLFIVPQGPFFDHGSAWLGWDSAVGAEVAHPEMDVLPMPAAQLTKRPRKYGFHGTIKPPFALAKGATQQALEVGLARHCRQFSVISIPKLSIRRIGGFFAIVPAAPCPDLKAFAAKTVQGMDEFRAPADDTELARRRKNGLSPRQEEMLQRWGYPYVMNEFKFHMTLTGPVSRADANSVEAALQSYFNPVLPEPFVIDALALMGEGADGKVHVIGRYDLA